MIRVFVLGKRAFPHHVTNQARADEESERVEKFVHLAHSFVSQPKNEK
jgi:hypothetical protein